MAARLTEQDLRRFISNVTGFQQEEENFQLCLKFASSNLKYHRFLDVNGHKVEQQLTGICEKLAVHSEIKKATRLRELSKSFLESPIFEHKTKGYTDTHYAILSLLLNISDSPLRGDYVETVKPAVQEVKDEFDWGAFLLDGVECSYPDVEEDLSDWSDSDTLDSPDEDGARQLHLDTGPGTMEPQAGDQHGVTSLTGGGHLAAPSITKLSDAGMETITIETANDWLSRNLVVQYWMGEKDSVIVGKYQTCNLHSVWDDYKSTTDPLHGSYTVVTEIKVIREVLWMLMGFSDLYLFRFSRGRFSPRPDLAVTTLTEEALHESMERFTRYGTQVQTLQKFVELSCYGNPNFSQTYKSFALSVANFLHNDLQMNLTSIEERLLKQEETVTLMTLRRELSPLLHRVDTVYSVYNQGIQRVSGWSSCSRKASHLLSVLYDTLINCDALFESEVAGDETDIEAEVDSPPTSFRNTSSDTLQLLLFMWLQTLQPYINIIDSWISQGALNDPAQEFIIQRNKSIETLDQTFWEKSFAVHTLQQEDSETESGETDRDTDFTTSDWAPVFLRPVLQQIVLTGKSMEMLEGLGKLAEHDHQTKEEIITFKEGRLYEKFLESVANVLVAPNKRTEEGNSDPLKSGTENKKFHFPDDIDPYLNVQGTHCPLLRTYFETLMTNDAETYKLVDENLKRLVDRLDKENLLPIQLMLRDCLYPHIQLQYRRVCSKLVHVLDTDFKLRQYLAAMRNFFLMEAGDTMFQFYTEIFDKIRHHEPWRDVTSITWSLHEALDRHFPEEVNRFLVTLTAPEKNKVCYPINVTDCIELVYQVPCPVDVVITGRCQAVYNQIFQFLMQIKRAKYCLDELRFCDLSRPTAVRTTAEDKLSSHGKETHSRKYKCHRMQLLRMKMVYFINSLHYYIMTRILHSTGLEFETELETATDLDQIIAVHAAYLRKIHQRCLLHHKNAFLKEAIMKVLNQVLVFQAKWDQGVDQISVQSMEDIDREFSKCLQFLSSFLNSVIQRKMSPHLESLALCLDAMKPMTRYT